MQSATTTSCMLLALCIAAPARAVVHGVPSGARDDAVVLVLRDDGGRCTGTLVAPDLVVLALHCVTEISSGPVACDGQNRPVGARGAATGGRITADIAPERLRVFAGTGAPSLATMPPAARGTRVYRPAAGSVCAGDLAVLRLDRPVTRYAIAPLRLERGVSAGEPVVVVGYGRTEAGKLPPTRYRRDGVSVVRVGPAPGGGGFVALADTTFEVSEGPCLGDSGGPAFDAGSGALVGVFSGGGNPRARLDNPASPCLGPDVRNRYTTIASFRELVLQAFHDAGYVPRRERQQHAGLARHGPTAADLSAGAWR